MKRCPDLTRAARECRAELIPGEAHALRELVPVLRDPCRASLGFEHADIAIALHLLVLVLGHEDLQPREKHRIERFDDEPRDALVHLERPALVFVRLGAPGVLDLRVSVDDDPEPVTRAERFEEMNETPELLICCGVAFAVSASDLLDTLDARLATHELPTEPLRAIESVNDDRLAVAGIVDDRLNGREELLPRFDRLARFEDVDVVGNLQGVETILQVEKDGLRRVHRERRLSETSGAVDAQPRRRVLASLHGGERRLEGAVAGVALSGGVEGAIGALRGVHAHGFTPILRATRAALSTLIRSLLTRTAGRNGAVR